MAVVTVAVVIHSAWNRGFLDDRGVEDLLSAVIPTLCEFGCLLLGIVVCHCGPMLLQRLVPVIGALISH